MYLSLKTILLGAAVASAIPFPPNGTHNVTKNHEPCAHPSIFGLPWLNPGWNNPPPENVTDSLDEIHKILDCLGINGTGSHNDTQYHSPRTGVTAGGIRENGVRLGHPIPPPKNETEFKKCLLDAFPHWNDTVDGALDVNRRDAPKLPHYIKRRDGNEVGHPSPPPKRNDTACQAARKDFVETIKYGPFPTKDEIKDLWVKVSVECQHGINGTHNTTTRHDSTPGVNDTGIWEDAGWASPPQRRDSAQAAPGALHAR